VSATVAAIREPATVAKRTGWLGFSLRAGVAAVLVLFLLRTVNLDVALATLANTNFVVFAFGLLLGLFDRFIMSYKWNLLLRARGQGFSHVEAFRIYLASGIMGPLLPTGVGSDVYRVVRSASSGRSMSGVSASIVLERAFGLLAVLAISTSLLTGAALGGDTTLRKYLPVSWALLLTVLAMLWASGQPRLAKVMRQLTSRWQGNALVRKLWKLHDAFVALREHRWVLLVFLSFSVFEQGLQVLLNVIGAQALGLPIHFAPFIVLIPLSRLLVMLPISIAGIGVLEGSYVVLLAGAGLSPEQALSLSILMRVMGWVLLLPAGLAMVWDWLAQRRSVGTRAA
jgi:uncharacterized protein (TIRG00374 family)